MCHCRFLFLKQQQAPSFNGGGGGDGKGVHHSGPLMQLSGKGLLHSGSWKRRYCVLDSQRLFYYPVKESSEAQIQVRNQNTRLLERASERKRATSRLCIFIFYLTKRIRSNCRHFATERRRAITWISSATTFAKKWQSAKINVPTSSSSVPPTSKTVSSKRSVSLHLNVRFIDDDLINRSIIDY